MARPSGNWLAYLRFGGPAGRVVHVLCYNRAQLDDVLTSAGRGDPASGAGLAESAAFHSDRRVYHEAVPGTRGPQVVEYRAFAEEWAAAVGPTEEEPA